MDTKTCSELIALCKERKIKGYSGKRKDELIALLSHLPVSPILTHEEAAAAPESLRIVSLFAGCGGLDYGFFHNPAYSHVLVSDFDKTACDTYEKNFKIKPV